MISGLLSSQVTVSLLGRNNLLHRNCTNDVFKIAFTIFWEICFYLALCFGGKYKLPVAFLLRRFSSCFVAANAVSLRNPVWDSFLVLKKTLSFRKRMFANNVDSFQARKMNDKSRISSPKIYRWDDLKGKHFRKAEGPFVQVPVIRGIRMCSMVSPDSWFHTEALNPLVSSVRLASRNCHSVTVI